MLDCERKALEWLDSLRLLYPGTQIIDHIETIQEMVAARNKDSSGEAARHRTDAQEHSMR